MEEITTLGIDLAKRGFALHGVNARGRVVLRRVCRRDELAAIVAQLSPQLCVNAFDFFWAMNALQSPDDEMAPAHILEMINE